MHGSKRLRQTTLAISADHNLIVDKTCTLAISAELELVIDESHLYVDGPPLILRLPDELLDRILDLSCPPMTAYIRSLATYRDAQTLMLVCQRFYQIARPILYRSIHSGYRSEFVPPSKRARLLHRTLSESQNLWAHCHDLQVHVPDIGGRSRSADCLDIVDDFLSWLTNVCSLSIHGGFSVDPVGTWTLIHKAVENMPRLGELRLYREYWGLTAERLYDIPQRLSLNTLAVYGISSGRYDSNDSSEFRASRYEVRSSTITKLELTEFGAPLSAFNKLLLWPKELHHFSFRDNDASQHAFSLKDFGSFLSPHKATLQSISLESLFSRSRGCIDVSDFPELKSITLSRYDMQCTPQEASLKLLAPQLESFTWSWLLFTQGDPSFRDFSEKEERWLRDFLSSATQRKSALRKVHIVFSPTLYSIGEEESETCFFYPWDLMDSIARDFRPHGIDLTYDEPPQTKAEVAQVIKEYKERKEAKKKKEEAERDNEKKDEVLLRKGGLERWLRGEKMH